ncbi:hypothetical protein SJ_35 [Proteus phage SJ_PmiM]|nr:hypothetical protein SJ_35 [Proteus phage SJ_PmiM]
MKKYIFKSKEAFDKFIFDNGTKWTKDFEEFVLENKLVEIPFFYSKNRNNCNEIIKFFNGLEYDTSNLPLYIFVEKDLAQYCNEIDSTPDAPIAVMPLEPPTGKVFNLNPNSVKLNLEVTTKEQAEAVCKLLDVFFE